MFVLGTIDSSSNLLALILLSLTFGGIGRHERLKIFCS